jgi:hypothetical protein
MDSKQSTPNYYAVIPANVRYSDKISASAKLLFGEVSALCNKEGYCWASNRYFARNYNVNMRTVQRWLSELKKAGFIDIELDTQEESSERKIWIKTAQGVTKTVPPHDESVIPPYDKNATHNNTRVNNINNSSEPHSEDSPVPLTIKSKKKKNGEEVNQYTRYIQDTFNNGFKKLTGSPIANWGKHLRASKEIAKMYELNKGETGEVLVSYYRLIESGKKFWVDQPFTPANCLSLWDTIVAEVKNKPKQQEERYLDGTQFD